MLGDSVSEQSVIHPGDTLTHCIREALARYSLGVEPNEHSRGPQRMATLSN